MCQQHRRNVFGYITIITKSFSRFPKDEEKENTCYSAVHLVMYLSQLDELYPSSVKLSKSFNLCD